MNYSPEMLQAHKTTVRNYERFIAFAEDESNSLDYVQHKAGLFHDEDCNYCHAARNRSHYVVCENCLLGPVYEGCMKDEMEESYVYRGGFSEGTSRKELIAQFTERLYVITCKAGYNARQSDE